MSILSFMSYRAESFGFLKSGEEILKITISNEVASFSILTLGATISSFSLKMKSGFRDVVCSSTTLSGYINDKTYKGEIIAPNANRIAKATFTLEGHKYQLDVNNGENNLHSGSANAGYKVWDILFNTDNSVVLNTSIKDGEGGFPGNTGVTVTYALKETTLEISYTISSDKDTPINPTNHVYFNLHGRKESIKDHLVKMNADRYILVNKNLIPTGCESVKGSDFDFNTQTAIGERRDGKYDNCFIFPDNEKPYVSISSDGLTLLVETDRKGMQIYSGEFFSVPDSPWGALSSFEGVALETSGYPDAVNNPSFPSVILKKGEVFKSKTSYTLKEDNK